MSRLERTTDIGTAPQLADLERLARLAGKILLDGYEKEHQIDFKGEIDLVTEIDRRSEAALIAEITEKFPSHHILAEESGGTVSGRHQWYIDPLDGTVNYAHGLPFFCVSIAYACDGRMQLAAVYDPLRDELFTAERGKGAMVNGRMLKVSATTELHRCLLVTGFAYDAWTAAKDNFALFTHFGKKTQGVRRLGSAALDLCSIAAGRLDGYWELSLKPWDLAAGALIAAEAGARVTQVDGGLDLFSPPCSILAAPPAIHSQMLGEIRPYL